MPQPTTSATFIRTVNTKAAYLSHDVNRNAKPINIFRNVLIRYSTQGYTETFEEGHFTGNYKSTKHIIPQIIRTVMNNICTIETYCSNNSETFSNTKKPFNLDESLKWENNI